jgi:hypothetical protein
VESMGLLSSSKPTEVPFECCHQCMARDAPSGDKDRWKRDYTVC